MAVACASLANAHNLRRWAPRCILLGRTNAAGLQVQQLSRAETLRPLEASGVRSATLKPVSPSSLSSTKMLGEEDKAWNNDYGAAERTPKRSTSTVLADVVGDSYGPPGTLLPLGAMLDSIDLCSGRAAYHYMEGPVVTVSFDYCKLLGRMEAGDFLRVDSKVIIAGSSSITLSAAVSREVLPYTDAHSAPHFVEVMRAQLTFVAVNRDTGRPFKNVPSLRAPSPASARDALRDQQAAARAAKDILRGVDAVAAATPPAPRAWTRAQDTFQAGRARWVRAEDSVVWFCKQYLPRHENFGGVVFGGDLLMLMERAAEYCGRRHVADARVRAACVALYNVHFKRPVKATFLLRTRVRVAYVRRYCMELQVQVYVDRSHEGKGYELSHSGFFTLVTCDGEGKLVPIAVGLDMEGAADDAWDAYERARILVETAGDMVPQEHTAGFAGLLVPPVIPKGLGPSDE